jgi:hypothetical protein
VCDAILRRLGSAGCDEIPEVVGKSGVECAMLILQFHIAVVIEDGEESV